MDDFPNAAEIREQMMEVLGLKAHGQLMGIRARITRALEHGQSSIRVDGFHPGVKEILEAKGYKVTLHRALDQRDSDEFEVSW